MDLINGLWLGSGIGLGLMAHRFFPPKELIQPEAIDRSPQPPEPNQTEHLEVAYQMAQELSQFKAGFLARTSHELRSPLNGLIGVHQLILSDLCEDAAEEREFLAQAHESALKLVQMLDEVISVSKVEFGSATIDLQPLALVDVLQDTYCLTYLMAENRALKLQIAEPDDSLYVLADPKWLRYVFVSLISSAIALMQEGTITVSVEVSDDRSIAHVMIEDERPANTWNESIDLLKTSSLSDSQPQAATAKPETYSPGFSLLLAQTVMQLMNGRLELLNAPSTTQPSVDPTTRLQCSIPLVQIEQDC